MSILGLHHITLICEDAGRTIDFYTRVLGFRLIKRTVNFDVPDSYHIYFGDEVGQPGTVITFFEWPEAEKGRPGIGGTHHLALQTADRITLLKWKRWLTDLGIPVTGPHNYLDRESIYLRDPDGVLLEITTPGAGWTVDEPLDQLNIESHRHAFLQALTNREDAFTLAETWPERVEQITPDMNLLRRIHHITAISSDLQRTHAFFGEVLKMPRVKITSHFEETDSTYGVWSAGEGTPAALLSYFKCNPGQEPRARMGIGQTHHFALAVADEEAQLEWREKLREAGFPVSPVMDRMYFKSIYTRDPDGHIVELATFGPGFTVDEEPEQLGQNLKLPPWLEPYRSEIEETLRPIILPA